MTYLLMVPYLKGLHLTVDSWWKGRDAEGWRIGRIEYEAMLALRGKEEAESISVYPKPAKRIIRAKTVVHLVYGFGDASGSDFGSTARRTEPFKARDITFWDENHRIIPIDSPLDDLLNADSATMRISNQKNGTRGGMINHTKTGTRHCPVKALARRVHTIMSHRNGKPTDIISTYFTKNGKKKSLSSRAITNMLKKAVQALNLEKHGFPAKAIASHSLRAGGAMAMHLNGVDRDTIRKMGRWSSDTFLMYIHEQISAFSAGLSKKMQREIGWHNIEGPVVVEPPAAAAA